MFLICRQSYDLASRIQNKLQIYFYFRALVTYSKLRLSERKNKYYLSFFEREEFPWAMRKTYSKLRKSITESLHQQSQSLIVDHQIQWNWLPNSLKLITKFSEIGERNLWDGKQEMGERHGGSSLLCMSLCLPELPSCHNKQQRHRLWCDRSRSINIRI